MYDTPGLCDGKDKDEKYVEMMRKVKQVDCFWYVTRLDDHRVSKDEQLGMQSLTNDLGPEIWSHAIIVFTHAGNARKDFSTYFNERASIVRRHIGANVPQAMAEKIPAVAVDNESVFLPDGTHWLAELYTVVLERISAKGALSFAISMQDRVKKKDDEVAAPSYTYVNIRNTKIETTVTPPPQPFPVDPDHLRRAEGALSEKVKKDIQSFSAGRVAAGAAAGAAVGAVVAGPVGAVVGGLVGGAVGLLSSIFGRKK